MIMKRLTPEDAWRAFGKGQKVYEIREIFPERTFVAELMQCEGLVTFVDTAEKETAEEGRTETTATEQEPSQEAVESPKQAKKVNHDYVMSLYRSGMSIRDIADACSCSEQTVRNHILRDKV